MDGHPLTAAAAELTQAVADMERLRGPLLADDEPALLQQLFTRIDQARGLLIEACRRDRPGPGISSPPDTSAA